MKRLTLAACGLMMVLALGPGSVPARAVVDAGGRSVFARGAAERALALGGAYAAVTDDASALIWNPAGLARLDRTSVYASQTNLIGLGFSEQLGLLALPSWRLGTFGLGIRRFGVDGIEGRDARGAVFDDNLKDSETEILLGYGRRVGGMWKLGLVAKYQQHSLAGYSAGAPGLDVGVQVKPLQAAGRHSGLADALSLGFAIRNLFEPDLRLDTEGVKDPTGLRLGAAYQGELADNIQLLLATDMEKTRDMDTRLHFGAEVRLLNTLALRVGSNAGMMTAGAGVDFRSLSVDYAFEDNLLEPVHRFGLGMRFGPTVEETRQTALRVQEAELRKKLARAFQQEKVDRIDSMVGQARRFMLDGDFAAALNQIETIRVLEPGYPGVAALEVEAYFGQGVALEKDNDLSGAAVAFQRCLAADPDHADAREHLARVSLRSSRLAARSQVIRARFDEALAAYARGELVQAKAGFAGILELDPDDREAAALLLNTTQALKLRADLLIDRAKTQIVNHDLVAAKANLAKARVLMPDHRSLAEVSARIAAEEAATAATITAARQTAAAASVAEVAPEPLAVKPVPPTFAELSAKEQKEVADLYRRGLRSVEKDRHDDAIRYWELVWSRAPDYQQVAENLKQEYLVQGMEAFAEGQLDQSIEIWERAESVSPGDPRTRGYLARAYEHRSRIREIRGDY